MPLCTLKASFSLRKDIDVAHMINTPRPAPSFLHTVCRVSFGEGGGEGGHLRLLA